MNGHGFSGSAVPIRPLPKETDPSATTARDRRSDLQPRSHSAPATLPPQQAKAESGDPAAASTTAPTLETPLLLLMG